MTGQSNQNSGFSEGKTLLAVALEAAQAGAAVIREAAPRVRSIEWRSKKPADFVSEVDLAAEAAVLGVVRARCPEAGILAEESGASAAANARVTFVVDPLDGTTNFLHGYPEYACSVGVVVDGTPTAGVIIDVALNETFTAHVGGGAFVNGAPIRVSPIEDPKLALIGTGFPFSRMEDVDPYTRQLAQVMRGTAGVRRAGAAALDLASVAAGRFEAFWETVLSPWDIAAGIVLVREAGGIVTDLTGAPCPVARTGVVAGNPAIHAWLQQQLQVNGSRQTADARA
jgi:myo-inositol-1(or 4)-monophosphatase